MTKFKYTNDIDIFTTITYTKLEVLSNFLGTKISGKNKQKLIKQFTNSKGDIGDIGLIRMAKETIDDYLSKGHLFHSENFEIRFEFDCKEEDFNLHSNEMQTRGSIGISIKNHMDTLKFCQYGSFMEKDYKKTIFGISTRTKKVKGHFYALFAWLDHAKFLLTNRQITWVYCDDVLEDVD
jgi:hypothetical protein